MKTNARNLLGFRGKIAAGTVALVTLVNSNAKGQGVIVSQTGPLDEPTPFSFGAVFVYSVSWTSTVSYSGVSISAALNGSGNSGTAFLTDQIGPGTTFVNQIATSSFAFPTTSSYLTLFTGLNLGPGTYYLSIQQNNAGGAWLGSSSQTIGASPFATANGEYRSVYENPPTYNPSDTFSSYSQSLDYIVSTPTPEPTTLSILLIGCGATLFLNGSVPHHRIKRKQASIFWLIALVARKLRVQQPGVVHHVLNCGGRRDPIFRDHVTALQCVGAKLNIKIALHSCLETTMALQCLADELNMATAG